jgi:hypothetical protein
METQAYFEDIQFQIKKELAKANYSIQIAVAWFTDKEIFDLLCKKAQKNVKIELIILNDKINKNSGIEFDLLNKLGSNFWFVGSGDEYENIMHNKFCIIDYETIITGSYNWTIKAQNNHENITIIKENPELAKQFTAEINSIKEKYLDIHTDSFNISKILIRLETLKNIIVLEDTEDIHYQVKKIKLLIKNQNQTDVLSKVNDIIVLIEKSKFSKAVLLIDELVNKYKQITVYIDPDIAALKLEIKSLELQLSSLEDEKADIEKLISDFEIQYNNELGKPLIKLLTLKKEKLKKETEKDPTKQQEFDEAENDFNEYENNYNNTKDKVSFALSDEEQKDLKSLYRKASKLCHPDVVCEEFKKDAEKVFSELKQAYDSNDLKKVTKILKNLEKGIFKPNSEKISEKEKLIMMITQLKLKIEEVETNLNTLKNNETYITISKIKDWTQYFAEAKEKILLQIMELENGKS